MANFSDLVGKTLTEIRRNDIRDNDALIFVVDDGSEYAQYHSQDCYESVVIEDICGDLSDLIGTPILKATDHSSQGPDHHESSTWTFYDISTIKGTVSIRWLGVSNGYYSESVNFELMTASKDFIKKRIFEVLSENIADTFDIDYLLGQTGLYNSCTKQMLVAMLDELIDDCLVLKVGSEYKFATPVDIAAMQSK